MIKTFSRVALVIAFLLPAAASARGAQAQEETNVNTRYKVESVSIEGVPESRVSQTLRDDMQKLVGQRYDPDAADALAARLRDDLDHYSVSVKVKRGDQPESVKVVFEVRRVHRPRFEVALAPLLYSTADQFTVNLVPSFETHHNYFAFGFVTDADTLLERNMGVVLRYEHRKVGTSKVQVGLEYDYFHPSFQPETESALVLAPQVPGIYRSREVFSPSVSVLPVPQVKLTFGATFQTLEMQYPSPRDEAANAFLFGVQFRQEVRPSHHVRHRIAADYSARVANDTLETDFVYTRQWVSADYTASVGRNAFVFRFQGGDTSGTPPLFERFSLGNTSTLRGWDKFDVAPLGGTRMLHGSLEYRYRPVVVFYDFGKVWDDGQSVELKHSVGFGLAWKNGFFMTLGVPLRYHSVTPVFMFGIRR